MDTIDFRLNNSSASHRMQELSSNKITVENPEADDINPYDVPEEQPHFYHEVQQERIGMPTSLSTDSYKYMNSPVGANGVQAGRLATTGQQMPMIFQGDPGVYSDPTELGSVSRHVQWVYVCVCVVCKNIVCLKNTLKSTIVKSLYVV